MTVNNRIEHWPVNRVLADGHEASTLAISSPLERYAVLRFLLGIIYLAHAYDPEGDWLSAARGGPLPRRAVGAVLERLNDRLWLFHPDQPFLQNPALRTRMPGSKTASKDPGNLWCTHPTSVLQPHVPSNTNEMWWYRTEALDTFGMAPPAAALGLIVRHYTTLPGNESDVLDTSGAKTRFGSGGVVAAGPRPVTHLYRAAPSISATLTSNMVESICRSVTPASTLAWEDPDPARHSEDRLWLYTASGAASYLVPSTDGRVRRLLRTPQPYAKTTLDGVLWLSRLTDPHTLRAAKDPEKVLTKDNATWIAYAPEAAQYEFVASVLRHTARSRLEPSLLDHTLCAYPAPRSASSVQAVTLRPAGSMSLRIETVSELALDPAPLTLGPAKSRQLRSMLDRLAGRSASYLTLTRHRARLVVDGDRSQASPAGEHVNREVSRVFWEHFDAEASDRAAAIAAGTDDTAIFPDEVRRRWINHALTVFDTVTAPYRTTPHMAARAARCRQSLRSKLWTLS